MSKGGVDEVEIKYFYLAKIEVNLNIRRDFRSSPQFDKRRSVEPVLWRTKQGRIMKCKLHPKCLLPHPPLTPAYKLPQHLMLGVASLYSLPHLPKRELVNLVAKKSNTRAQHCFQEYVGCVFQVGGD